MEGKDSEDSTLDGSIKNFTLLVTTLGAFLTPYMSSAVNIALPVIGLEFKMSAVSLSWIATVYFLAAAIFLVPFGRWRISSEGRRSTPTV